MQSTEMIAMESEMHNMKDTAKEIASTLAHMKAKFRGHIYLEN